MKKIIILMICFVLFQIPLQAAKRKRIGNRLKISLPKPQFKQSDLLDAVQAGDKKQVKKIFDQYHKDLDEKTINEVFVKKTVTGHNKNLKPKVALLFLEHPEIKKKLNGESLDKALMKSMQKFLQKIISAILQEPLFRKKLYTSKKTHESFERNLKYISKKTLYRFLSYPDLCAKVRHLDFITQDVIDAALNVLKISLKPDKEKKLLSAVDKNDLKEVTNILNQHHQKIDKKTINEMFIKTVTGCYKNLKLEIALLFLKHPQTSEKLNGHSLDKALIKAIQLNIKNLFSAILQNPFFRNKLYTNETTKESFEKNLKLASKYFKKYLFEFLSYPDLHAKVQHLDFITQKDLGAALEWQRRAQQIAIRSEEEQALFRAIEENNLERAATILNKSCQGFHENTINEAFVKTVTGGRKNLRPEITLLFLEHPEIKQKLKGKALDKAFIKSIQESLTNLFYTILQDSLLKNKLYTHEETKKDFEKALKYIATQKSLKKLFVFLSHHDLCKKVQHLDFITRDILDAALEYKKRIQEISSRSDCEKALLSAVEENDGEKVVNILDQNYQEIRKNVINEAFVKTVTGDRKKDLKSEIAVLFLEHPEIKKKLNGQSLDKAFIKAVRYCLKNIFSTILQSSFFRNKLYMSEPTKELFEKFLKFASKYKKGYIKETLSHPDLQAKVQHLDCIKPFLSQTKSTKNTQKIIPQEMVTSQTPKTPTPQEESPLEQFFPNFFDSPIQKPFDDYEKGTTKTPDSPLHFEIFEKQLLTVHHDDIFDSQEKSLGVYESNEQLFTEESELPTSNLMLAVQQKDLEMLRKALSDKDAFSAQEIQFAFMIACKDEWASGIFELSQHKNINKDFLHKHPGLF